MWVREMDRQIISSKPLTPVQQEQAENTVEGWATLYTTTTRVIWGTQYQPVENQPPFDLQPKVPLTVKHFQRVLLMSVPVCVCVRYSGHSVWGVHTGVLVPWLSKLRALLLHPDLYAWFPSCGNGGTGLAVRTDARTNLSPNHIVQIFLGMILHALI